MASNGISTLPTKEEKQKAKLGLASVKRGTVDTNGYRAHHVFNINNLPTRYDGNNVVNNGNAGGLTSSRPWINGEPFTFFEAFGTTSAIATTQLVYGNQIYVYASTFDVPSYQNSRVVVNEEEVLNIGDRGHNMVVLDVLGNVLSTSNYDTYGVANDSTLLYNALNAVSSGNIVVLTVWDASALTGGVRSILNSGYGSTNNNTWSSSRTSQIFIGVKI